MSATELTGAAIVARVTTYRARCGATIVRDVEPGPFVSVRNRLADYIEAQRPGANAQGNVSASNPFRLAANRVRLWREEGAYLTTQFVKLPGDRRYRIEVDPTATDPDELTLELE
jgi:hypothetical protein